MLTDVACKSLISKSQQFQKPIKKSDSNGLFLLASPKGRGFWRYKYRHLGKENQISFGAYPDISLADARIRHAEARKLVLEGINPVVAKRQAAAKGILESQSTFEFVGNAWFKHNKAKWSPDHAHTILLRLRKDLYRSLGHIPVAQLTRKEILNALRKIEERNSHEVARRSMQFAKQILGFALNEELVQVNVALGLETALRPFKTGHFPSMPIEMLPGFLKKLNSNDARLTKDTRDGMRLLMLTLVRTSELIKAEWKEIDLFNARWVIPAERMKMRLEHIVPLSKQVIEILTERKRLNDAMPNGFRSGYVFPSQFGPHKHMCERTIGLGLFAMGYRGIHTGHGFRALGMGIAQEKLGYRNEIPDRQLSHVPQNEVRRAYDRAKFLDERTEMMQKIADYVSSIS